MCETVRAVADQELCESRLLKEKREPVVHLQAGVLGDS